LHAVDGVVVTASTVGLEAALIGTQVLSVECSVFSPDVDYVKNGVSIKVSSPQELPEVLLRVKKRPAFTLSEPDVSSATDKIIEVVDKLLGET
jgi:predicted glycosyltransferase